MKKMQLLHQYLLSTGLVKAEQINTTVTEGIVVFHAVGESSGNVAFSREYVALIEITAYAGDADKLDAALVWWCGLYQPELAGSDNGYDFKANILNTETVQLSVAIPLTERVRYDRTTGEMLNCVTPLVLDDEALAGIPVFLVDTVSGETTALGEIPNG